MKSWFYLLVFIMAIFGGYMIIDTTQPTYYVLVGPPGAGKGSLSAKLSESTQLPVITTSMVLKKQMSGDTPESKVIQELMAAGKLISDDIISQVLYKELQDEKYAQGAIFDGFPRTLGQTQFFQEHNISIDMMIVMDIEDDAIIQRMAGRRVHPASGRVYHIEHMPPKTPGQDDLTGEPLIQRPDDTEEIMRSRLADYHKLTKPIIDWAAQEIAEESGTVADIIHVDAALPFEELWSSFCLKSTDEASLQSCVEG